jgi:ribose transport system substrate-binding protein
MKKKVLLLACMVLALLMVFSAVGFAADAKARTLTVGYIMGGPELWQQSESDGVQAACKKLGYNFVSVNSEYTPEKELSNAEDLISKHVDAIIMFTVNANSGQKVAKMCNDAKIPLFLLDGDVGEGPGKAISVISYDFYECGKIVAQWVSKNMPKAKMAFIMGLPGAGITEAYQKGVEDGLSNGVKLVDVKPADWDRAKAMKVMEDLLTSKKAIDVVYVNNDDMAVGVIKALKDAGKLGKIKVVTDNGSPDSITMIKSGDLLMTVTESPAYQGVAAVKCIRDHFKGLPVPATILVPLKAVTKDNLNDILPWDVTDALVNKVLAP